MSARVIARPELDWDAIREWIRDLGGIEWIDDYLANGASIDLASSEALSELAGRRCYRSFGVGLNPNVTRVRGDTESYLKQGIIAVNHGSVLEHAQYTFAVESVSRVLTHELVRHRVGIAISQESLRYVRLSDIPFWWPDWAKEDPWLYERGVELIESLERFQLEMAQHFELDEAVTSFAEKKAKTSFMRRFAPEGLTTGLVWSANVRTLRHVIRLRSAEGVEEEILAFARLIGTIMLEEAPLLFDDLKPVVFGEWR